MTVALDTNVLAYAEGVNGEAMRTAARELVGQLRPASVVLPVQVLGELFNVLIRNGRRSRTTARDDVLVWRHGYPVFDTTPEVLTNATRLSASHGLNIWDAVILSAASAAGCSLLLSEDLQDGFVWDGVTVANPFAQSRHPLLKSVLGEK